ncbi:uncharacterized protein VNE69_07168 [Vairimorpha necatrix]|uniref:Uncharacterized protein n=1 Tax=Vairimorpha necatrix TaxID=6039 RepID=A0AAX4JDR4_9MICR
MRQKKIVTVINQVAKILMKIRMKLLGDNLCTGAPLNDGPTSKDNLNLETSIEASTTLRDNFSIKPNITDATKVRDVSTAETNVSDEITKSYNENVKTATIRDVSTTKTNITDATMVRKNPNIKNSTEGSTTLNNTTMYEFSTSKLLTKGNSTHETSKDDIKPAFYKINIKDGDHPGAAIDKLEDIAADVGAEAAKNALWYVLNGEKGSKEKRKKLPDAINENI